MEISWFKALQRCSGRKEALMYKYMLSHTNSMYLKCAVELSIPIIIHNHQECMIDRFGNDNNRNMRVLRVKRGNK
ncbi:hypothetical protein Scep_014895 [Stephania cephalantha]|uniref:Uncharacterized protein n=1 Tax=Stephania cephalantha TaxID=152367 RepID=A0AAP0J249_9MAGN